MTTNNKKLCIATPMYGGMCAGIYLRGVVDTVTNLNKAGYDVQFFNISNESLITRARNQLVHQYLETDAEYFLFVDADIGFCVDDVFKLINSDKDLICGLYPKKSIDWDRIDRLAKQGVDNLKNYSSRFVINPIEHENPDEIISSPIVEIKHAGTGFMLIRRKVFDLLMPFVKEYRVSTLRNPDGSQPPLVKEFFALDIVGEDKYLLSEDYFFCNLWRRFGGKVYADISIKLTHLGSYEFSGDIVAGGVNPSN